MTDLFDLSQEYDAMLTKGIRLSGETKDYFAFHRVKYLRAALPAHFQPTRILDFGCGVGTAMPHLMSFFPDATIVGVDTAVNAIEFARKNFKSNRTRFFPLAELADLEFFDLCYTNGVFHHIEPQNRAETARRIYHVLNPNGYFALFENNPWNPGTRLVMSRIPFDRDAKMLSIPEAHHLVKKSAFHPSGRAQTLFYFPSWLAPLRFLEPSLKNLPLGAQYCILGAKS